MSTQDDRKSGFVDYVSNFDAIQPLSMEQRGVLMTLRYTYAKYGEVDLDNVVDNLGNSVAVDDVVRISFLFMKNQMVFNDEKYKKKCETNRKNGALGGRPKKEENPKTERFLQTTIKTLKDNDIKNKKDIDVEKYRNQKLVEDYAKIMLDIKHKKTKDVVMINKDFSIFADIFYRDSATVAGEAVVLETERWIKERFAGLFVSRKLISEQILKFFKYGGV